MRDALAIHLLLRLEIYGLAKQISREMPDYWLEVLKNYRRVRIELLQEIDLLTSNDNFESIENTKKISRIVKTLFYEFCRTHSKIEMKIYCDFPGKFEQHIAHIFNVDTYNQEILADKMTVERLKDFLNKYEFSEII